MGSASSILEIWNVGDKKIMNRLQSGWVRLPGIWFKYSSMFTPVIQCQVHSILQYINRKKSQGQIIKWKRGDNGVREVSMDEKWEEWEWYWVFKVTVSGRYFSRFRDGLMKKRMHVMCKDKIVETYNVGVKVCRTWIKILMAEYEISNQNERGNVTCN